VARRAISGASSSSPTANLGTEGPRECRLKEFTEIVREPESEQRLRLTDSASGETGIKFDPVDRSVRGDDPKPVLGSAELVDQVLPVAAAHSVDLYAGILSSGNSLAVVHGGIN
jgi:hypothetical protein